MSHKQQPKNRGTPLTMAQYPRAVSVGMMPIIAPLCLGMAYVTPSAIPPLVGQTEATAPGPHHPRPLPQNHPALEGARLHIVPQQQELGFATL